MSLKNIILFLLLTVCVQSNTLDEDPIKKNIIFLWDIHGVILKTDFKSASRVLLYESNFKSILRNISRNLLADFFKLSLRSIIQGGLGDDFIYAAYKHNNHPLVDFIIKLSNTQKPISETVAIIEELHTLGYRNHIGSNIAFTTFQELIDKEKYPQFSSIFNNFELDKSQVVHYALPEIKKPNVEFFNYYFIKNNINLNNTTIIFIDDKRRNVAASYKAGCIGILFQSGKQLRHALRRLGIPLQDKNIIPSTSSNIA